jgi:SAM-dependent methyltransferase
MDMPPVTAEDYDRLPYRSVAYAHSSPDRMAAVGQLFGLALPPPDRARVLELGCASGGNLIPLAVRHPKARCVGVDLSQGQVAEGAKRVAALGLDNIEILHGDIAAIDLPEAAFDYLVVHGVWSWIPHAAQEAVFAIARRCLVPGGMAYISYNTLPGWHLRQTVRDLCSYHAGQTGEPALRVARARWLLDKLGSTKGEGLYGDLFRKEAAQNARQPDSYILGEFLADHNTPCYFHEFVSRAQSHGLAFLCEAELASSIPETLAPDTARVIREIAGDNGFALEQYIDFFIGRQFRRSLLLRPEEGAAPVARSVSPARLVGLHMASSLHPAPEGGAVWIQGNTRRTVIPMEDAALRVLHAAAPATVPVTEVIAAMQQAQPASEAAAVQILGLAFRMALMPGIELLVQPRKVGRATDALPCVCPLARVEAASGQGWLTTRRHEPVSLAGGLMQIVPLVDGSRDRAALVSVVAGAIAQGGLQRDGQPHGADLPESERLRLAEGIVAELLARLERLALLLPPEGY